MTKIGINLILPVGEGWETTPIREEFLTDKKLSLSAKGFYLLLLTYYPSSFPSLESLSQQTGEEISILRSALAELEDCGYVTSSSSLTKVLWDLPW